MESMITKSEDQTKTFAKDFVHKLNEIRVLALSGELGAGKTTFVQGLAIALGVKQRIISPTFIIVRSYKLPAMNSELKTLYHIDLYRVEGKRDMEALGIEEILNDKNAIVVIEWAEKLGEYLPKKRFDLHFRYVDETTREIMIEKHG